VVITISFLIFFDVAVTIALKFIPYIYYDVVPSHEPSVVHTKPISWFLSAFITRMAPAFIIHLWLPLFAISSLFVKLVYLIFRAVEWAQWFLKQGDAHPLRAIGIVATIIVFGSAMLVKEAWTVL
jgi:hypothetical protein